MSEPAGGAEDGRRVEADAIGRGFAATDGVGVGMGTPVLQTTALARSFRQGDTTIEVLRGVDLSVAPGEIVALLGPSGSGKSTLLQAVGLLEGGFEGSIRIAGTEAAKLDAAARTTVRRDRLGFVYQFHHLLPDFDATENVILPQLVKGTPRAAAQARAASLLTALGLGHRLTHRPSQLSGGEQQRVAVARALANRPTLVLADEPTGNLDEHTADIVLAEFLRLVRDEGSSALVATHNERLARKVDRVVRLHEGRLEEVR
jgi:lipoprotein-releasing system ATP-binding protein